MKARYFYSPPIFSNTPKLSVLTENGILYSEHKEYGAIHISKQTGVKFDGFDPSTVETEDYPIMLEISFVEACDMPLNHHNNWIERYVSDNRISTQLALPA